MQTHTTRLTQKKLVAQIFMQKLNLFADCGPCEDDREFHVQIIHHAHVSVISQKALYKRKYTNRHYCREQMDAAISSHREFISVHTFVRCDIIECKFDLTFDYKPF